MTLVLWLCSTPQINTWTSDWIEFYVEHRLGYQLKLARDQFGDSSIYEKGFQLFTHGLQCSELPLNLLLIIFDTELLLVDVMYCSH